MAINLASKYSDQIAEVFTRSSFIKGKTAETFAGGIRRQEKGGERSHLSTARQYRFGSGAVAGKIQSLP